MPLKAGNKPVMRMSIKLAVVGVLCMAVAFAMVARGMRNRTEAAQPAPADTGRDQAATLPAPGTPAAPLPKLLDLGAKKCVPCKMMMPVLDNLKAEYAGRLEVVFIDVWEDKAKAEAYDVRIIPTQIFYNAAGQELFRHEGFFAEQEILAKWQELGVDLASPAARQEGA